MNNHIATWLAVILCLQLSVVTAENLLKNPDFEELLPNKMPTSWTIFNGEKADLAFDDQIFHSGTGSLRISGVKGFVSCQQSFGSIDNFDSDYLLSGWVKYDGVRNDTVNYQTHTMPFLGIWTSAKGRNNMKFNALAFPPGSHDWQYFEKVFRLEDMQTAIAAKRYDNRPTRWAVRINLYKQPGTVWFDDLKFVKLQPATTIDATLNSQEYFVGQRNGWLTIMLKNADEAQTVTTELQIKSARGKTVFQQKVTLGADTIKVILPTSALPAGSYRLSCLPEAEGVSGCELPFKISDDPFAD